MTLKTLDLLRLPNELENLILKEGYKIKNSYSMWDIMMRELVYRNYQRQIRLNYKHQLKIKSGECALQVVRGFDFNYKHNDFFWDFRIIQAGDDGDYYRSFEEILKLECTKRLGYDDLFEDNKWFNLFYRRHM